MWEMTEPASLIGRKVENTMTAKYTGTVCGVGVANGYFTFLVVRPSGNFEQWEAFKCKLCPDET